MLPCSLTRFPGPSDEKQAHSITDPPSQPTVGIHSPFQTKPHLRSMLPRGSVYVSSNQSPKLQLKSYQPRKLTFMFVRSSKNAFFWHYSNPTPSRLADSLKHLLFRSGCKFMDSHFDLAIACCCLLYFFNQPVINLSYRCSSFWKKKGRKWNTDQHNYHKLSCLIQNAAAVDIVTNSKHTPKYSHTA